MNKVLAIAFKVTAGLVLVGMIVFGVYHIQQGAKHRYDARARTIEAERAANLRQRSKKQSELEQKRADQARAIRAKWGGPEVVDVLSTSYPLTKDNVLYVMTKLHINGTPTGASIIRPVPVELTDRKQLAFWWCKTPSSSCDPGYGKFYAIDDPARPSLDEETESSHAIDLAIAQAYKDAASIQSHQDSSVAYWFGAAFHYWFIVWWCAIWLIIGFAAFPSWREAADEFLIL